MLHNFAPHLTPFFQNVFIFGLFIIFKIYSNVEKFSNFARGEDLIYKTDFQLVINRIGHWLSPIFMFLHTSPHVQTEAAEGKWTGPVA